MTCRYSQSITREHRTAVILAIDFSGSMSGMVNFEGRTVAKANAVAEIANRIIFELIERARRGEEVRDYYDIAVVAYYDKHVESAISNDIEFISVCELARRKVEKSVWSSTHTLPDGGTAVIRTVTDRHVLPMASGSTPMHSAMSTVCDLVERWCADAANADSFPPMVFNITDGEFSDCNESEMDDITRKIRSLGTTDGNVLLLNVHLSDGSGPALIFPTPDEIPTAGRNAERMAGWSSLMPEAFEKLIGDYRGGRVRPPFIGMSYNAPITELLNILNIGSISVNTIQ